MAFTGFPIPTALFAASKFSNDFASRAAFQAAVIPEGLDTWSIIASGKRLDYVRDASGTAITSANGVKGSPADRVTVAHFGAVIAGNNLATAQASSTDSTAAFQSAVAHMAAKNIAGAIYVGIDYYRLTDTIDIGIPGVWFEGVSPRDTVIYADHVLGPVFRFRRDQPKLLKMNLIASAARQAALVTSNNCGVMFEAEDVAENNDTRLRETELRDVHISGQPSHGVVATGAFTGQIELCVINANGGHGIAMGRVVYPRDFPFNTPGLCTIQTNRITNNGGHAFAGGAFDDFSSPIVRVELNNNEIGGNALDAAVRIQPAEVYYRGADMEMRLNVLKPADANTTISGYFVAGRNIHDTANRFINCKHAGIIGSYDELSTRNIHITGHSIVTQVSSSDPTYLVTLPSDETIEPKDVFYTGSLPGTTGGLFGTDATMGSGAAQRVPGLRINGDPVFALSNDVTVNNSVTFVTVPELRVWLAPNEKVMFQVDFEYEGTVVADLRARMQAPTGATFRFAPFGSIKVGTDGSIVAQSSGTGTMLFGAAGADTGRLGNFTGFCQNGSTAGYLFFQFAQGTAEVSDTILKAGITRMKVLRGAA